MISQSLYHVLCRAQEREDDNAEIRDQLYRFKTPYVLVVHRKSKSGWYADHELRHLVDVTSCESPRGGHSRPFTCAVSGIPTWAEDLPNSEFDTFFLY